MGVSERQKRSGQCRMMWAATCSSLSIAARSPFPWPLIRLYAVSLQVGDQAIRTRRLVGKVGMCRE